MSKDSLGDRMKTQYEDRFRTLLPRRVYTILRLDGRAFHTYARRAERPFDARLMHSLNLTGLALAREVMGMEFGYLQSDELSFLLTDFHTIHTEAWFDGNVQKIVSVAASIATAAFARSPFAQEHGPATFDARVFCLADPVEVTNYFIWRQKDWERNSLQMLARAHFSHKALHGKKRADLHDMLHEKGINWTQCTEEQKEGRLLVRDAAGRGIILPAPMFTGEAGRTSLGLLIPPLTSAPASEEA